WVAAGQEWKDDAWSCPACGGVMQRPGDDWFCGECGLPGCPAPRRRRCGSYGACVPRGGRAGGSVSAI
ncbi:hypothetical protein BU197_00895, partial [Streptomyces sp. CBMA291]|nr:hypothetical protein [Streptomyces sp. CBMA291]